MEMSFCASMAGTGSSIQTQSREPSGLLRCLETSDSRHGPPGCQHTPGASPQEGPDPQACPGLLMLAWPPRESHACQNQGND